MEDLAWLKDGIIRAMHWYGGPLKEDKGNCGFRPIVNAKIGSW